MYLVLPVSGRQSELVAKNDWILKQIPIKLLSKNTKPLQRKKIKAFTLICLWSLTEFLVLSDEIPVQTEHSVS